MVHTNNSPWLIWTSGIIATIFLSAITILGTNVIANETRNVDSHATIRKEVSQTKDCIVDKLDLIQKNIGEIRERQARMETYIKMYEFEK